MAGDQMFESRIGRRRAHVLVALATGVALLAPHRAWANDPDQVQQDWAVHGQITNVTQYHPSFTSNYRGTNSLDPGNRGDETIDATR
jgi:high affinity Mn2+ porin